MDNTSTNSEKVFLYRLTSIIIALVYIVVWSIISVERFYAMKANVWDLGFVTNLLHSIAYNSWSPKQLITQFANQGIAFIAAPLALFNSIPSILVFQSVMLGLPAYLLFEICLHENKNPLIAALISVAYVLYFPLAGANWFDVQLMNLFIFLFLLAYLLLIKGHYVSSIIVFLLSGMVRFPFMGLIVISSISLTLPFAVSKLKDRKQKWDNYQLSILVLLILSSGMLCFQYAWIAHINTRLIVTHYGSTVDPFLRISNKLYTVLYLVGPLLFLPFLSKKWILSILPFFGIVFFFNNFVYEYPTLFSVWYSVMVIPFLFLGLIDTLSWLTKRKDKSVKRKPKLTGNLQKIFARKGIPKLLSLLIVIILISLALFLQPYGPFNSKSFNNFDLSKNTVINATRFNAANTLIKMIPLNASYVLVQNDLPQLFPRTSIRNIIVAPYNVGPDLNESAIAQNKFPFNGGSYRGFIPINYGIVDINDVHSLTEPAEVPGYFTMIHLLSLLIDSKYYGIVAEDYGLILLKRNYSGLTQIINPYHTTLSLGSFNYQNGSINENGFQINSPQNNVAIRTEFQNIFPGEFNVKLAIQLSGGDNGSIQFNAGYYNTSGFFIYLNRTDWNPNGSNQLYTHEFTVNITASTFLSNLQFYIVPVNVNETLIIGPITITQIV